MKVVSKGVSRCGDCSKMDVCEMLATITGTNAEAKNNLRFKEEEV